MQRHRAINVLFMQKCCFKLGLNRYNLLTHQPEVADTLLMTTACILFRNRDLKQRQQDVDKILDKDMHPRRPQQQEQC